MFGAKSYSPYRCNVREGEVVGSSKEDSSSAALTTSAPLCLAY